MIYYSKKPAWWFFWMAIIPFLFQLIPSISAILTREDKTSSVFTFLFSCGISWCWVKFILPARSVYYMDDELFDFYDIYTGKKEPFRRSVRSGIKICVTTFLIIEILLFLGGVIAQMQSRLVLLVLHVASLYYFVLGLLHVYFLTISVLTWHVQQPEMHLRDFNMEVCLDLLPRRIKGEVIVTQCLDF